MFKTKYYSVEILPDNDPTEFCWGVVNNKYGTCEHKAYSLPGAISVCSALSQQLQEVLNEPTEMHVLPKTVN